MDPRDYISNYEGREEASEPEKPHCQACGKKVDEVSRCVWDKDLLVGKCCETYIDHRCPECGSDHLARREFDYGRCRETHYHDAGLKVICHDCGSECDERDREVKIGPMPLGSAYSVPRAGEEAGQDGALPAIYRKCAMADKRRKGVSFPVNNPQEVALEQRESKPSEYDKEI